MYFLLQDVAPEYLEPAMDRLAEFFIHPLFDKKYVDKERLAVDSEYNMGLSNENERLDAVLKQLANPLHPFSRFSVGSTATLPGGNKSDALRQTAIQFYSTFYTLNRMNLGMRLNFIVAYFITPFCHIQVFFCGPIIKRKSRSRCD